MILEIIIAGIFIRYNGGMKLWENDRIFKAEKSRMKEIET